MRRRALVLLSLWLLPGPFAALADPIELFTYGYRDNAGKIENFTYAVEAGHAAKLPDWTPADTAPPPLEYGRAVEMVRDKVEKTVPPQKDWKFIAIQLDHITRPGAKPIWYYHFDIHIFPVGGNTGNELIPWTIVVLMDGKILAPDPFK